MTETDVQRGPNRHTLRSALEAARQKTIEDWIHQFLNAEGRNPALSQGLKLFPRSYFGPVRFPLRLLERNTGPEGGKKYPVSAESFEVRVGHLMRAREDSVDLPPLIVQIDEDQLELCDGNHRWEALSRLGATDCAVIFWATTDRELQNFLVKHSSVIRDLDRE